MENWNNIMKSLPYGRQNVTQEDIDVVIDTLNSNYLTQGPKIAEFEEAFANYIGCKYAVAVCNGTAALHLSALALNIKEGDKVITTPITFAASANCIRYCGGEVVFSDIDPSSYLLDIVKVEALLENSPKGTFKGIIPVDFSGRPLDLEAFRKLADRYNLWIIEDACHAPGGYFTDSVGKVQNCGNGNFADLAIFSFHPVKHIACGEGGMITTNDAKLHKRLLSLRTHGITKNESEYINSVSFACGQKTDSKQYPGWYMEMQDLGFNYRITDFQAALGTSQLKRANEGIERRKEIAKKYSDSFGDKDWVKSQSGIIEGHAYHLYVLEVENRLELFNYLKSYNIFSQVHYIPTHLMPYYRNFGWKVGDLPIAEEYYANCISLPMYPTLTEGEQDYVINKINEFYNG
jgi:UDP-4-amino-4,6-dideoxy-N-acetyl-beta-L-altrosamine transaminase